MTISTHTVPTTDEALAFLDAVLDLSMVRQKLADPEEGNGYDAAHLDLLEAEYRKFLALHLAYPAMDVVPCKIVDEMWHQHILDTAAYRDDLRPLPRPLPILRDARRGRRPCAQRRIRRDHRPLSRGIWRAAGGHLDQHRRDRALQAHRLQAAEMPVAGRSPANGAAPDAPAA